MSYISGHYRKGHFRNGKWVNGGYVKGHSRSGFSTSYGTSSCSVNASVTKSPEDSSYNDAIWNMLYDSRNMKIINEMMENLDNYSYSRTLRFFEVYSYSDLDEDYHYAEIMLLMNICTSIDELLFVREFVKKKISTICQPILEEIPDDISIELSGCVSRILANDTTCFDRFKYNLMTEVNSCYDENLFRLFKENKTITANICGEYFINQSLCSKHSEYKNQIINEAKESANIDVSELLETIAKRYEDFGKHWNDYKGFKVGMNGYVAAREVVEEDFEYLKQFNWRLSPTQKSYYSEIDKEDIKKKEESLSIAEKKWRKDKEECERKQEATENKAPNSLSIVQLISIIIGGLLFGWLFVEGGAWSFAILFILLLLKKGL